MFSLCLPSSPHLSACSFRGSPRWDVILMKIVKRPWSFLSRRSCTMSLIMSASGFPCIEGDFPSPVHFWEEERMQAESDRRITGFLFCCLLESSSARHTAPNSTLFDEFPSTPRPSWQQPPICSSNLKKPAPMTPRSFDLSVAYTVSLGSYRCQGALPLYRTCVFSQVFTSERGGVFSVVFF